MKRIKVFIIAVISILLIVSLGKISFAEPNVVREIGDEYYAGYTGNGKIYITYDDLKDKYKNVLCVARGVSITSDENYKRVHSSADPVEYCLMGTAEIVGNQVTLTEYNWEDNYNKMVQGKTETFTTVGGQNNMMAAILTTDEFKNGYSGEYARDENGQLIPTKDENGEIIYQKDENGNLILDENGDPIPEWLEEAGSKGPKQLCTWGFWDQWVESLPDYWESVFKKQGWSAIYDSEQEDFIADMQKITNISATHIYRAKINFVQHICTKRSASGATIREPEGQKLIVFEQQDPEIEIVIEKDWRDKENSYSIRPEKMSVLVETYQHQDSAADRIYIPGEDKIIELTAENDWRCSLNLKIWPENYEEYRDEDGWDLKTNRRYRIKEVFEIQDDQDYQLNVVEVSEGEEVEVRSADEKTLLKKVYTGGELAIEITKESSEKKIYVGGEYIATIKKESLAFPKVEVIDGILYIDGKHVVESAYVDGKEVADIVSVNGYKLTLDENGRYIEPVTDEEVKNRKDTVIKDQLYAVVKEEGIVGNTSYILNDITMINVDNEKIGTTSEDSYDSYDAYVNAHIKNRNTEEKVYSDKEIYITTKNAYVLITNQLELVDIPVKKVWNCSNADKIPESVTVQLLANGEVINGKTITLNASNNWAGEFANLMKFDNNGNEIKYTIQEIEVPGFASEITGDVTNGYTITNTYYDGYYEIKGTVWLDGKPGKDSTINGTLESEDVGIPGIKVTLYYNSEQFDASSYAYTDNNGEYTIKVNYDNSSNVYKLYRSSSEVSERLSSENTYIEFEYDGMVYTTVRCDTDLTAENTSKAREDRDQRLFIDEEYYKVNSTTPEIEYYNKTIEGTDKTIPAIDYDNNTYWNKTRMYASTRYIINSFTDYKFINTDNEGNPRKEKEIIRYCNGDTNGDEVEEYICTNPEGAWKTVQNGKHDCTNCVANGHSIKEFEVDVITIDGINLGLIEREKPDTTLDSTIHKVDVKINGQEHTYTYNEMNPNEPNELGKLYQNQDDAIYIRNINPANIVLANKNSQNIDVYVTYSIGIGNQAETLTTVVDSVINDYDSRYEIDSVIVETLNAEGSVDPELTKVIDSSALTHDDTITTHKRVILNNLGIKAEAGKASKQIILIRYKVNPDAVLGLLSEDIVLLNNATEIESYETYYGDGTLYAEEEKASKDKIGTRFDEPYAGYDLDSHPGNAGIELIDGKLQSTDNLVTIVDPETGVGKEQPEDDTDIAPPFKLDNDNPYTIAGTVWEDKDEGTETGPNNYRVGNGIRDDGETNLANVKVTLMEVLEDGTKQIAKLYHGQLGVDEEGINAEVYTDKNGNYSFTTPIGASEEYAGQYSIPAGYKYELKFTYGNEDIANATTAALGDNTSIETNGGISARNYKSTIISSSNTTLYDYFKNENENEKWHLYTSNDYSIAIDDLGDEGRIKVDKDLYYENFDEGKNISADSKPFIMTIEFTTDNESEVEADGKTLKGTGEVLQSELSIFDFGIIERAREDLVVSKTINMMEVKLLNGSTLASGDPSNKEELNFVKAQGLRDTDVSKSGENSLQRQSIRQAMLEMDSEITQGSTVNLKYEIIVTNNGEKDIDYEKDGGNYYKFGIIPANPENYIMSSSVDCLVTYVNKELNPEVDETVWQSQQVNTLRPEEGESGTKLISQATKEAVGENEYIVYTTTGFNGVKPGDEPMVLQSITANKRLTFKEDNAYDVHSEILVIDGKVARTIDSVGENGKQIPKTYKSGNFVPSLEKRTVQDADGMVRLQGMEPVLSQSAEVAGVHEQDDDSVKVTITQPTGITKYITTYVIATLIGLIVIVIGIVFIKKKVLTR